MNTYNELVEEFNRRIADDIIKRGLSSIRGNLECAFHAHICWYMNHGPGNKSKTENAYKLHRGKLIDELELSVRALNVLKANNIFYIKDLCRIHKSDLRKMKGLGRQSIAEIEDSMDSFDLKIGMLLP